MFSGLFMLENEVASKVNLQKKVYHARFACGLVFICNVIGAIISIFILTIDFSQLYRAFLMSSSSSLWPFSLKRYCFGSLPRLSSTLFAAATGHCFLHRSSDQPAGMLPDQHQTAVRVSD